MAESILRLRVESSEFDSKIKRATQGIIALEDRVKNMGATLAYAEQEDVDFVRAIGSMETVAKTAKGKLAELTNSVTELSVRYKQLTQEEKNSPYGQAMKSSIEQLTQRQKELKAQLGESTKELNGQGSVLDSLTSKFGINIKQLGAWGLAAGALSTAAKVVKDAFFNNEEMLDEWGRATASAKSLYEGFINSLNGTNPDGFLQHIDDIVKAAREAYDSLDALGTFNAFNQINVERARTDYANAVAEYREGTGSKEAVRASVEALNKELSSRQSLESKSYIDRVAEVAAQRGVNADDLMAVLSGSYDEFQQAQNAGLTGTATRYYGGGMFGGGGSYQVAAPANEVERMGVALRALTDTEIKELQALGAQAQRTATEIANNNRAAARILRGNGGGTGGSGGGVGVGGSGITAPVDMMSVASYFSLGGPEGGAIKDVEIISEDFALLEEQAGVGVKEAIDAVAASIEKAKNDADKLNETWNLVAGSVSTVGGALAGLENPAAKVVGTVLQAIATLALSYAEASAKASKLGPVAWIGFAATGLATFLGASSAIKNATSGFAEGGIVPGSSFVGDTQIARVNSGEMIINQADQRRLYDQIHNGSTAAGDIVSIINAEQLVTIINNHARRTGRKPILQ